MSDRPKVVGLGGSLSAQSASRAALEVALDAAAEQGAETALFDVRTMDLPMFRREVEAPSAAVEQCDATFEAHGMIWSSPLYHGTISGAFKNALDWLDLLGDRDPPFLTDKVIGLISTAGDVQGSRPSTRWSSSYGRCGGWPCRSLLPSPAPIELSMNRGG